MDTMASLKAAQRKSKEYRRLFTSIVEELDISLKKSDLNKIRINMGAFYDVASDLFKSEMEVRDIWCLSEDFNEEEFYKYQDEVNEYRKIWLEKWWKIWTSSVVNTKKMRGEGRSEYKKDGVPSKHELPFVPNNKLYEEFLWMHSRATAVTFSGVNEIWETPHNNFFHSRPSGSGLLTKIKNVAGKFKLKKFIAKKFKANRNKDYTLPEVEEDEESEQDDSDEDGDNMTIIIKLNDCTKLPARLEDILESKCVISETNVKDAATEYKQFKAAEAKVPIIPRDTDKLRERKSQLMYCDLEYEILPEGPFVLDVMNSTKLERGVVSGFVKGSPHMDYVLDHVGPKIYNYCRYTELGKRPYLPKPYELCIAKLPHTYGVRAYRTGREPESGPMHVNLAFIDYGHEDDVPVSCVRRMLPEFVHGIACIITTFTIKDYPQKADHDTVVKTNKYMETFEKGRMILNVTRCEKNELGQYTIHAPELIKAIAE